MGADICLLLISFYWPSLTFISDKILDTQIEIGMNSDISWSTTLVSMSLALGRILGRNAAGRPLQTLLWENGSGEPINRKQLQCC